MKSEPATPSGQAKTYISALYRKIVKIPMRHCSKLVLMSLLGCTNTTREQDADFWQTRVSQAYLAEDVGRTTMTVRRALSELKELGIIHVRQRGLRYTNVTTIDRERLLDLYEQTKAFREGLGCTKKTTLDEPQMFGQGRTEMRSDLSLQDRSSDDLEIQEYPSAEAPADSERHVGEGVAETYTSSTAEEPQSPEGLPDEAIHYGDLIEAEAYEQIVSAHEREEVADGPAQAALKGVQRHRYDLGRLALALALSTGILDAEIVSSVRQWVRKCVCVHSTTDRDHYVRILVAFLDAKAERVGKMSGRLESS